MVREQEIRAEMTELQERLTQNPTAPVIKRNEIHIILLKLRIELNNIILEK